MPGRPAKSIELHLIDGKKHLTKAEIKQRQESEVRIGDDQIREPDYVREDPVAHKKWLELKKLYSGTKLASSADVAVLARYCVTHSEWLDLRKRRALVGIAEADWSMVSVPEEMKEALEELLRIFPLLAIEKALEKKSVLLQAMEDRLFLNPLAKVKNVPKQPTKEKPADPLEQRGFGNL